MKNSVEKLLAEYEKLKLSEVIDYEKFNGHAIVHHSSSIEGSTLNEVETRLLLDEGLTPKGKPLEHSLMTRDHYTALKFILSEAEQKRKISPEFIQQINAQVMGFTGNVYNTIFGTVDASKGEFRKGNVSAGGSYFPNYSKVEALVTELSSKINALLSKNLHSKDKLKILELSFMAHFNLVSIHPFYDGNGRTSRLLMNYIQRVGNLALAIVFKEDKADYFIALEQTRKEKDFEIFNQFMYSQYEKYLKEEIRKYKQMEQENKTKGKNGLSMIF